MKPFNKSEIGVLIAVRMKSSRLASKALADIVGKPLIIHLIERMKRVRNAAKIVLCTSTHQDDRILLDIADQEGILKFAGSELDVMKRFIAAAELNDIKTVVRVTGDNPLTDPENIDRMIEKHHRGNYDFVKSEYLPLGVNAEVVSLSTLKKAHQMAYDTNLTEYMTSYLKRPDHFKIHTVENNDEFFSARALIRLTVDFDEDLLVMNKIYGHLYPKNPEFDIGEVLLFLDNHPEVLKINENMLEIPLPKIRFKGEKEYDKKLVILGRDVKGKTLDVIEKIKEIDEYEITGFIYHETNLQYSLVEGIPILGDYSHIDQIKHNADYFFVDIDEPELRKKIIKTMNDMGLKQIHFK